MSIPDFEHTGTRLDETCVCPRCGGRFGVVRFEGKPSSSEAEGGVRISIGCNFIVARYCPMCGKELK